MIFGALTALEGPRLAAQQSTRWMGIAERINVYGCVLWESVLAIALLREPGQP